MFLSVPKCSLIIPGLKKPKIALNCIFSLTIIKLLSTFFIFHLETIKSIHDEWIWNAARIFYSSYFCSWVKYETTLSKHSRQRSERENQSSSFAFSFKDSGTSDFTRYRLRFRFIHCDTYVHVIKWVSREEKMGDGII